MLKPSLSRNAMKKVRRGGDRPGIIGQRYLGKKNKTTNAHMRRPNTHKPEDTNARVNAHIRIN